MEVKDITIKVKDLDVQDVLCNGLEGGIGYWGGIENYVFPEGKTTDDYTYPHLELPFEDGGAVILKDHYGDEEDLKIDKEALERGLQIMANKYQWHFMNILNDNADAETGDVLVQCATMGDIVYG